MSRKRPGRQKFDRQVGSSAVSLSLRVINRPVIDSFTGQEEGLTVQTLQPELLKAPEVVVEVHGDGGLGLGDGYSRAEIRRHLQEAEGGRGEGQSAGDEVVLHQPGAQVGAEVDAGQQAAVGDAAHSWRSELKR